MRGRKKRKGIFKMQRTKFQTMETIRSRTVLHSQFTTVRRINSKLFNASIKLSMLLLRCIHSILQPLKNCCATNFWSIWHSLTPPFIVHQFNFSLVHKFKCRESFWSGLIYRFYFNKQVTCVNMHTIIIKFIKATCCSSCALFLLLIFSLNVDGNCNANEDFILFRIPKKAMINAGGTTVCCTSVRLNVLCMHSIWCESQVLDACDSIQ